MPDLGAFLKVPEERRLGITHLFRIRFVIWSGEPLSDGDHTFWESCRQQVPDFPLFRRLKLSQEDQKAQEDIERQATSFLDAMHREFD